MLKVLDDAVCQLLHGRWAEAASFSRQGAWRCSKSGCKAQARHDRDLAAARFRAPFAAPPPRIARRLVAPRNHAA
jgi:hypothetical protein